MHHLYDENSKGIGLPKIYKCEFGDPQQKLKPHYSVEDDSDQVMAVKFVMYHSIPEEGGHGGGDGGGDDAESQNGVCDFGVLAVLVEDEEGNDVC